MAIGYFSDPEWKGSFLMFWMWHVIVASYFWAIVIPPLHYLVGYATPPELSPAPPSYGFHLIGNLSFFSEEAMNRTDMNESSPTYGMWTPPPEWRDHCIEAAGMPLSACSYFQYQEYPTFMTFFYVMMLLFFVVELVYKSVLYYRFFLSTRSFIRNAFRTSESISDVLCCWGCEKNPTIGQNDLWQFIFLSLAIPVFSNWQHYHLAISYPGIGLVNSMRSGMLYFGAGWNDYPLETNYEAIEWTIPMIFATYFSSQGPLFNPKVILWPLNPAYAQTHDALITFGCGMWAYDIVGLIWECIPTAPYLKHTMRANEKRDITFGSFGQNRFYPTVNEWSLRGVWTAMKNMDEIHPRFLWLTMAFQPIPVYVLYTFIFTAFAIEGEREKSFYNNGMMNRVTCVALVAQLLSVYWLLLFPILASFKKGKGLLDEALYNKRLQKFEQIKKGFGLQYVGLAALYSPLFMPFGMAMQMFAIKELGSWPSPMNAFFAIPGSPANMLATPLHRLASRFLMLITWFFFLSNYLWDIRYPSVKLPKIPNLCDWGCSRPE